MAKQTTQQHSLVISALDKTKATFKSIQSELGTLAGKVNSVKGAMAGVGIALSSASFASLVKGAIESTAALKKLQQETGLTAEAISGINYATKGDTEEVAKAIAKLAKAAFDAKNGVQGAKDQFLALGISFQKAGGQLKTAEELFSEVSGVIARMPDGLEKSALAQKMFGEEGAKLIPLLNKGGNVFKILGEEASKYGVVLTQDVIDSSAKFVKETQRISAILDSGSKVWAAKLAPGLALIASAIQGVVQEQSALVEKNKELSNTGAEWVEPIITGASFVIDAFAGVKRVVQSIGGTFGAAAAVIVGLLGIVGKATVSNMEAVVLFLKGDMAGAKKVLDTSSADAKATYKAMQDSSKKFAEESAANIATDLPGQALRRSYEKAKKDQVQQAQVNQDHKNGVLTVEEQFKNRMLAIQKELSQGMEKQVSAQIRELDRLKSKLDAAKKNKSDINDTFENARNELLYGSTASQGPNAKYQDISNQLASARRANDAGKYDVADSEAKKVIASLQELKSSQPGVRQDLLTQIAEAEKASNDAKAKYLTASNGFGSVGSMIGISDDKKADAQDATNAYKAANDQLLALNNSLNATGLSASFVNDALDKAKDLANEAATKNVDTLQSSVDTVSGNIDKLVAKMQALSNLTLAPTVDNEAALKSTQSMLSYLDAYIQKNPLVITPVIAPAEDSATTQARSFAPATLASTAGFQARTPTAATGGYIPAADSQGAAQPKQPVNLSVPGVGTYQVEGGADVVKQMNEDFMRAQLKAK